MIVFTHRGIESDKDNYFKESSKEAFFDQISRKYSLEIDVQFSKDDKIVLYHDSCISRFTNNDFQKYFRECYLEELLKLKYDNCHLATLKELIYEFRNKSQPEALLAIHLKKQHQTKDKIDLLLSELKNLSKDKFFIFDVTIETAKYIRSIDKNVHLAASVAHPHDIKRFSHFTENTLLSISKISNNPNLFSWVWLDEWDRKSINSISKKTYTKKTISKLKKMNLKIAVVSPELHRTSPNLLGNECHEDAENIVSLQKRVREIITLNPDAICTDYSDLVSQLLVD